MIEGCIFSLINMPLIAMRASQYMSMYVALRRFARDLVTWYLRLRTWYLGSTTQYVRNHSLFARLIHDFDWSVYQFSYQRAWRLFRAGCVGKCFSGS